jgi:hypothetical protein
MQRMRCARCGRERLTDAISPEGLWASFDDGDVCPECQTEAERHDAELRVVGMIEREAARRDAEGVAPDEAEGPLVRYAMGTRAKDADADPVTPGASRRLRVEVTGAFLTGHPLALRGSGYREVQQALGRALPRDQWTVEDLDGEHGTFESGGGFTEAVPLVIARRMGLDLLQWLSPALDRAGLQTSAIELEVDVYDLGVAVMTAGFDMPVGGDLASTARAVNRLVRLRPGADGLPPLADALQQVAYGTTDQYGTAVAKAAAEHVQPDWLSRSTAAATRERRGRLLWLHPVLVLHTDEPAEQVAHELAPPYAGTTRLDEGLLAAGIGWSAAIVSSPAGDANTALRLTKLHWAYYALYMEIDRGLLGVLDQARWAQRATLKQLENDADAVFADYLRVVEARARLDSALTALGGDELAIWDKIAEIQRFDTIVDAVGRKLDALEKLAKRRIELAEADRARLIGSILGALSFLTIVTVAAAIVGQVLGSRAEIGPPWLRYVSIGAGIAVAIALYVTTFFWALRRARR